MVKLGEIWERASFSKAEKVLFTSARLKSLFVPRLARGGQLAVVPIAFSSVDQIGNLKVRKRQESRSEPLKLLFIGRFVPYKGLRYLIDSLAGLENVRLELFGDGKLKSELIDQVQKLRLEQHVFFHSDLCEAKKAELLSRVDVLVLPSIHGGEAFGIVQLEALARGIPVINTYLPTGTSEVSLHEISGLTVRPSDAAALRSAIIRLRDDPGFYEKCSQGALERIQYFREERVSSLFVEALKDVLSPQV